MADFPFFSEADLDQEKASFLVQNALSQADDGELYCELKHSEGIHFSDGKIKNTSFNITKGFGFRAVAGEMVGYAHSSDISQESLQSLITATQHVHKGYEGIRDLSPHKNSQSYYAANDPITQQTLSEKITILKTIDHYLREKDPKVSQVSLGLLASYQNILILRGDGSHYIDQRPLVRFNISVITKQGDRQETGSCGTGGRVPYNEFLTDTAWKKTADEALRQALVNLESKACPAGECEVVLGAGWPGVLLHEAVGHGLEGDFNRKKTSAFSGLIGEQVAAKGVTVIDDGTISKRRGSLTMDDEGTPTQRNTLIEDGILKNYMHDRLNGRLMGSKSTGNGRRESYAYPPLPRMTNTFMLGGQCEKEEIIESVKDGIYATNFGGGQVDITSGKFVFECTEAYKIENGKVSYPIKGATLIGSGPEALKYITMIGNDMALDQGIGTCGKAGQGIPCGVGQPTMKLSKMVVGGTG